MNVLELVNLVKRFGGVTATDHVDFSLVEGEIHALIGPNGAGKTTLIGQIMGEIPPDSGSIRLFGENVTGASVRHRVRLGLARSFQIVELLPEFSLAENLALAIQVRDGHSFRFWGRASADKAIQAEVSRRLTEAGLAARADIPVAALSHGERKDLELVLALASNAPVLLLDEPMAGLGPSETAAMIASLRKLKGSKTILLVEHDMDAVFALADRISVLVYGRIIATGTPAQIRANSEVQRAYLGEAA
ncbi:MAG: ABC transporter ATP-binding protein [Rhizobiales bacterium]|nr:ABC transporter ATP-binding protein [Hyphomicrobiales bacterium]